LYFGAGLLLYDLIGGAKALPRHRHLGRRRAYQLAQGLRHGSMVGAIVYYDAQMDDARLTLAVVRTAVANGVVAASGVQVEHLLTGDGSRVSGASVIDVETGERFDIRARAVVSAAGVWTGEVEHSLKNRAGLHVRASKGVHLVVPRDRIDSETGLITRTEKSVLFLIPWQKCWIVGTTDTDWAFDRDNPAATEAEVSYLLQRINAVLEHPICMDDIISVYAGLRPLVSQEQGETAELSREHAVVQPLPGLTVVAGGKFTTYRIMARDAVDSACRGLNGDVPPAMTDRVPLLGGDGFAGLWERGQCWRATWVFPLPRLSHYSAGKGPRLPTSLS
jgi:glycerol-3-phosphate dehydrogenase